VRPLKPDPTPKSNLALDKGKELVPELANWHEPDKSAASAVNSFKTQYASFVGLENRAPPRDELEPVLRAMVSEYPQVHLDLAQCANILTEELGNVKPSASPGYPLMRDHPTNADVFRNLGYDHVHALVMCRLELLAAATVEEIKAMSAEELCAAGFVDPIRVFVKNEVHSTKKVDSGKYRLIMSVSLIDQLVERVLNGALDRAEIASWDTLPSKPGMGLHDEGLQILSNNFKAMKKAMGSDMAGFDWHTDQWMLDADAECRAAATGDDSEELHMKRAQLVGNSVFVFSDGRVYAQRRKGLQKSGAKTTSSGNSRIRTILAKLVGGVNTAVCAMGDDAVEDVAEGVEFPDVVQAYAHYGMEIKAMEFFEPNGLEFCAYKFYPDGSAMPVRWDKMLAAFLYTFPQPSMFEERLFALEYELRHSPHLGLCVDVVERVAHLLGGGAQ